MSILQRNEVATFLGIDPSSEGLDDAIRQAELLTAGKLGVARLELATYDERRVLTYTSQQIAPKNGPIQEVTAFTYNGDDVLADVEPVTWVIRWSSPYARDFDRVRSFERMSVAEYTYRAGWTHAEGEFPLPGQVAEYIKSLTGIVYQNLLASGVYDTKLGDMTIKIQRETLEKNMEVYDRALSLHSRPF